MLPEKFQVTILSRLIMPKLTKSFLNNINPEDKDKTYWDDDLKGFGLRVQGDSKSWIIMYRNADGRQKKLTIGKANVLAPKEAREQAKDKLAEAVKGYDPAEIKIENRRAMTVAELCDLYLRDGCENKKSSTIYQDTGRIERHIKPLIGNLKVKSLTSDIIEKMMLDIARGKTATSLKGNKPRSTINVTGGKSTATRTIAMVSSMLTFAIRYKIIDNNPALGIKKFTDNKKDVFLDLSGVDNLGKALKLSETNGELLTAISAIKLLILTGCRKTEALSLKWEYVDFNNKCFRFPDTKTGKQTRAFGQGALNLLSDIKETSTSEWVFPSNKNSGHLVGLPKMFKRICSSQKSEEGNQPMLRQDLTLHSLRHSFASIAADMGYTELTIAGLLGHSLGGVTNRYSHNVDSSLVNAADKISLRIEQALEGKEQCNVIEFKRA
jgi:integrase